MSTKGAARRQKSHIFGLVGRPPASCTGHALHFLLVVPFWRVYGPSGTENRLLRDFRCVAEKGPAHNGSCAPGLFLGFRECVLSGAKPCTSLWGVHSFIAGFIVAKSGAFGQYQKPYTVIKGRLWARGKPAKCLSSSWIRPGQNEQWIYSIFVFLSRAPKVCGMAATSAKSGFSRTPRQKARGRKSPRPRVFCFGKISARSKSQRFLFTVGALCRLGRFVGRQPSIRGKKLCRTLQKLLQIHNPCPPVFHASAFPLTGG